MRKTQELNPSAPVAFDLPVDFQPTPLTVTGDFEAVKPLFDAAEALQAREATKRVVMPHVGKSALEAPKRAVEDLFGRVAVDVKTVAYDKTHGTSFYNALRQKRDDERNLRFATKIGLISLEDVSCRKHEHAVAKMRAL